MKKIIYILFLVFSTLLVKAQYAQNIVGDWKGWYVEGQKSYGILLEIKRFNGIVYEGVITLNYEDKEAQFSVEGDIQGDNFMMNERDIVSHYAPDYIINPQWCKADYEFTFSNLGDRFQLDGVMKLPKVNIAYVKGVKVYNSPKCTYFEKGEIRLQRKNPEYQGEVHLEEQKERVVYVPKKTTNIIEVITGELISQPQEYEKVVIGGTHPINRSVEEQTVSESTIAQVEVEKESVSEEVEEKESKKGWFARLKGKVFKNKEEETVQEEVIEPEEQPIVESVSDVVEEEPLDKPQGYEDQVGREVIETNNIESNEGIARIQVWDNRTVDGDIISIYHNGQLVEENISLLKEKKNISVTLEKGKNVIVMHAVNLGETPPNSAAMLIHTGSKQYSMVLTSDTKKSESIVIYYYP